MTFYIVMFVVLVVILASFAGGFLYRRLQADWKVNRSQSSETLLDSKTLLEKESPCYLYEGSKARVRLVPQNRGSWLLIIDERIISTSEWVQMETKLYYNLKSAVYKASSFTGYYNGMEEK